MGNPKRDGVPGRTEYAKHGIRHRGRGVRGRENSLVRREVEAHYVGEDAAALPASGASGPLDGRRRRGRSWQIHYLFEGEWHAAWQSYASKRSARDAIRTFQQKKQRFYPKGWRGPSVRIDAADGLRIKNKRTGEAITLDVC